jgi:type III restriction enzyme
MRTASGWSSETVGAHILNEKVRGKLLTIDKSKIVLLTRGCVAKEFNSVEAEDGWSMVRPLTGRTPTPEHFDTLPDALTRLAWEAGAKVK